ncbi:MAG: response regulator [Chroococcidiopsidaceae cyanobacterium CP_BM_ER_R8_30]|nr:response regulator [Chroococcidiopsidaceae cyanobacterium CP_BM_ER_R8_30]
MTLTSINSGDFLGQFTALKQGQFSGQVLLKGPLDQTWIFYMFLGRILYATGGVHPVRRWRRNLLTYWPQIDIDKLCLSTNHSINSFNICWEYQLLHLWMEQQKLSREQAAKVVVSIVTEVLFDVTQAMHVTYQSTPENLSLPQLVFLDSEQLITEVKRGWAAWCEAKIADRSPNRAPIIQQPEQLQSRTSPSLFQVLTTLLDGQGTLRDLAVKMKRDVVSVTHSLLPYIQAGLVELTDIPDLAAPVAPVSPGKSSISPVNPQGPIIACVDDSPLVCQSMERILTDAGYQFVAIQDSLRAIATLLIRKPDLIFLDLVMPNTNGYEICTQLRKVSAFRDIPIIILTGNDGIIDRVRAKLVRASGFLSKPINAEIVLETVRQYLNNSSLVM